MRQLAQTNKGIVEYASVGDKSTEKNHLFILHGTPGGYDSGRILTDWLGLDDQTHVIVPSRPGYLRTPISVGQTPVQAAEAMIALMDSLGIEHTTVLGWSGGALTALEMAQRFPTRVEGLVLLSPRVMADDKYQLSANQAAVQPFHPNKIQISADFFGPDFTAFCTQLGFELLPSWLYAGFFPDDIADIELTMERAEQLAPTALPPSRRTMGRQNDYWNFAALAKAPQYTITMPTLIIHSPQDEAVSFEHAQYLIKTISQAELYQVENESHFSTMNAQAVGRFHTFLERLRK